jgi:dTDP-4-dehydrorhamnose 3,5-epimerase
MLTVTPTNLPDAVVLEPVRHGDARGFFSESWSAAHMKSAGLDFDFVQDNHSFSSRKGTVRGLHFQAPPQAQDKLVRCLMWPWISAAALPLTVSGQVPS